MGPQSPSPHAASACIIGITLLLRVSTIAGLMAGTVISNPLTFAAQYYLSWKVGNMILPGRLDWNQLHELLILVREASFIEGIKIMGRLGFDAMLFRLVLYLMVNGGYTGQPSARAGSREHTEKQRKCHNETRISHR